jgi:integrase
VLSAQELASLLDALDSLPGAYSDAVRLLLLTGARREMVLGGRRDEVHLSGEPMWVIPGGPFGRSKSGEPHVIPLSKPAVAVLERRLGKGDLLFPRTKLRRAGDAPKRECMSWSSRYVSELQIAMGTAWLKAAEEPIPLTKDDEPDKEKLALVIPRWTIHNLRHTIATHLREDLGIRSDVVSLLLGHTPEGPRITRTYLRAPLLPERRVALVAWAAWLDGLRDAKAGKLLSWKEQA